MLLSKSYLLSRDPSYYFRRLPQQCLIQHSWSIIGKDGLIKNQELCNWSVKNRILYLTAFQHSTTGTIEIVGRAKFSKFRSNMTLVKINIGFSLILTLFLYLLVSIYLGILFVQLFNLEILLNISTIYSENISLLVGFGLVIGITLILLTLLKHKKSEIIFGTFEREFSTDLVETLKSGET